MKKQVEPAGGSILKTLAYADLFDYPLTAPEIWKYLIASEPIPGSVLEEELGLMSSDRKLIGTDHEYYYFKKRNRIVRLRDRKKGCNEKKLKGAKMIVDWVRRLPTVKMIGVTGALAMQNADPKDDIDLLFIVSPRRLWLTRGLIVLALRLFGRYRRPGKTINRICPNLFLDEEHLELPDSERSLYTAHEIAQVKCLWDRGGVHQKLLNANKWVLAYLPNAFPAIKLSSYQAIEHSRQLRLSPPLPQLLDFSIAKLLHSSIARLLDSFEKLAFKTQLFYMHSKRTREIAEPGRAFFHPRDRGSEILLKYQKRLTELGIPS